jgi:hypothetical protein
MNPCACCGKPIGEHRQAHNPRGYCDCICFAAHQTLTELALKIWRSMCWKLDVTPTRPVT